MIANTFMGYGKYIPPVFMHAFNELCIIILSLHSFYDSTYVNNVTYHPFRRQVYTENTKK
jgi:hypothetical protein